MATIEHSVQVDVPVRTAYNQWTQFEEFPRFMEGVKEVRQIDDTHLHWRAEIAGKGEEWDAVIAEQIPDERVAWHSTSGAANAGVVTFHRIADGVTRVMLQLDYEPEAWLNTPATSWAWCRGGSRAISSGSKTSSSNGVRRPGRGEVTCGRPAPVNVTPFTPTYRAPSIQLRIGPWFWDHEDPLAAAVQPIIGWTTSMRPAH